MIEKPGAALVTGAGRRLGRAMALYLASQGYDLALHYNRSLSDAEALVPVIESFGQKAVLIQGDLSQPECAESMVNDAVSAFPKLNILINNASIFYPLSFEDTTPEIFDNYFNIHLKSPFFLTQAFAKHCQKGQIINLLDTDVVRLKTNYFPYLLSKKALTDLTLMSAKALGPQLRVNAIAPGYILPPEGENDDRKLYLEKTLPLRRVGNIEEIQRALQSILDMPFVTGQIIYVDGGQHLV